MVLGLGLAAGVDVDDVQVVGHVGVVDMADSALPALSLPGADLNVVHVGDVEGRVDHHLLVLEPVLVRVRSTVVGETLSWGLGDLHVGALHNHGSPLLWVRFA